MKIYTSRLKRDDTAEATIQMTKAEFQALRKYMGTPDEFAAVKLLHGVYVNYRGPGWYVVEASNTYRSVSKIEASLSLVRKFCREVLGHEPLTPPRGTPFVPAKVPPFPLPPADEEQIPVTVPDDEKPPTVHRQRRGTSLFHSLFARV
jgi:hypothetical protein